MGVTWNIPVISRRWFLLKGRARALSSGFISHLEITFLSPTDCTRTATRVDKNITLHTDTIDSICDTEVDNTETELIE